MTLSLIVAVAENGTIGRDGAMPWRLSADLRRFRELTMGHCIIMGRKTYESIGRALPGRRTIVLTRTPNFTAADVQTAAGWDRAMQLADGDEQPFVIGEAPRFLQRRFPAQGACIKLWCMCGRREIRFFLPGTPPSGESSRNGEFRRTRKTRTPRRSILERQPPPGHEA